MFYISSRGSTATTWLAKILSKHPKIVCFRSTLSFPPVEPPRASPACDSGIPQISAARFMKGLLECSRATLNEKVFGSIHGYHGIAAKKECEKAGGIFSFMTRHPVTRIHSIFIYYLYNDYYKKYNKGITNSDVHDHVCSVLSKDSDLMKYAELYKPHKSSIISQIMYRPVRKMAKNIVPDSLVDSLNDLTMTFKGWKNSRAQSKASIAPDERDYASKQFVGSLENIFGLEAEVYSECPLRYGIKMEEMVKSKAYFKNHLWQRVAPQISITDSYLESVFSESRFNVHRDVPLSPEEIWKTWPSGMKRVFLYYFEKYNVSEMCKDFGYDISFI